VPETREVLSQMGVEPTAGDSIRQELHSPKLVTCSRGESTEEWSAGYRLIEQLVSDRDGEPEPKFLHAERLEETARRGETAAGTPAHGDQPLHLLGGVTQEQVGVVLGVSNSRVCQIEATAVQALRTMLTDAPESRSTMRAG